MKQKMAKSSLPGVHVAPKHKIPRLANAMAHRPPASPSSPSVIFTALLLPTKTNNKNIP